MKSSEKPSPEAQRVDTAQQQSEQAMQQSLEAQKHANDLEKEAQAAHQDVLEKQKELAQAQAKAQQLRQESMNAQKDAALLYQRSQQIARESQQQAVTGQQAEAQAAQRQQQIVTGKLTAVSGNQVVIYNGNNRMTLQVTPQTSVSLDGQQASLNDLPSGADVRAAFTPGLALPQASRIDARTPQQEQNQNQ